MIDELNHLISELPIAEKRLHEYALDVVSRYGGVLELASQTWGVAIPDRLLPNGISEIKSALMLLASLFGSSADAGAPQFGSGYVALSSFVTEADAILVRNFTNNMIDCSQPGAERALVLIQEQAAEGSRLLDEWKIFLSTL